MENAIEHVVVVLYRRPGKRWTFDGAYPSMSDAQKVIDTSKEIDKGDRFGPYEYATLEGPLIISPESMVEAEKRLGKF